ncbi:MAG: hypothetical protein RL701_3448 [Pseudomonadota bacterium]
MQCSCSWLVFAVAFMPLAAACSSSTDRSLEGKHCATDGACLSGWMCNEKQLCVRSLTTQGQTGDPDALDSGEADGGDGGTGIKTGSGGGRVANAGGAGASSLDAGAAGTGASVLCPNNLTTCDNQCVDTKADAKHCGACTTTCVPAAEGTAQCVDGQCRTQCPAETLECSGRCVAANTSAHCTGCTACAAGQICNAGKCLVACSQPKSVCGNACVDMQTDINHCGACETVCAASANEVTVCQASKCVNTCDPRLTACSGGCVDIKTSADHCGACGHACAAIDNGSSTCADGACKITCANGYARCGDGCVSIALLLIATERGLRGSAACLVFSGLP